MAEANVLVETADFDSSDARQIGPKIRTTALLADRRHDIESAVREASTIARDAVASIENKDGWHVKSLQLQFGLTIAAQAGAIVSKASADASFQVIVTIERG